MVEYREPFSVNVTGNQVGERLRVVIADDNPAMLEAEKRILQSDFQVVAAIKDPETVVTEVPKLKPDVVILDISMGETNGFDVSRQLKTGLSPWKIIFLTVHEELDFIRAAFNAGASGYVFKSRMNTDLCPAINTVQSGKVFIPDAPIPQYDLDSEIP